VAQAGVQGLEAHLGSEGAVEPVGGVVRQLCPSDRSVAQIAGVEHHELRFVPLAVVQLRDHPPVVFLPVAPRTRHEHGLTQDGELRPRTPHLAAES
jgi:hypothetical protein